MSALWSMLSRVWLFATLCTVAHQAPLSMEFPRKNTGVVGYFLFQGNFPTQESNLHLLCLLALQANSLPQSYYIGEVLSLHSSLDNPYWYFPSVFIVAAVSNLLLVSSNSLSLAVTSLQLHFHLSIFPLISWILYHRNTQSTVLVLSSFLLLFFCQRVTFSCFLACVEIF